MKKINISQKERHKYDVILHLPHHISSVHPPIPGSARAAQFAPFLALTGHDAAVREAARLTAGKVELDENVKEELNRKLQMLQKKTGEHPLVKVTYFIPDPKKQGGSYEHFSGYLKKIEVYSRNLIFMDNKEISIDSLTELELCHGIEEFWGK